VQIRAKEPSTTVHRPHHCRNTSAMATLRSWLSIPIDSHFSLSNIPFGIITSKHSETEKRPAVAIGDHVLDLKAFVTGNGFSALPSFKGHVSVFSQSSLNAFAALGRPVHREVRAYLQEILSESTSRPEILKDNAALQKSALLPKHETKTHLPMQIGDYTDFFAGINHAFNVGYFAPSRIARASANTSPALCSADPPMLSNQTTSISQWGTTAEPRLSSSPAPQSVDPTVKSCSTPRLTRRCQSSVPAAVWTSNWSSAASSAPVTRWGNQSRSRRPLTRSSASYS
jgi:hypothetical protein